MPASSCTFPRQMLPPPTTIATETPSLLTSAICAAIACVVLTSTLFEPPAKASPEIFNSTRENRGRSRSLTEGVSCEAPDPNAFAERSDRTIEQVPDGHAIVLDEGLVEEAMLFEPFVQPPGNDLLADLGGLPRRYAGRKLLAQGIYDLAGHALAIEIARRHRRAVHRDVARKFRKPWIASHKIGLAVDLDQDADLPAGMHVACDEPFVCHAFGFSRSLRGTAFEQQRLGAIGIAAGIEQRLTTVHHRRARGFPQRLDLFGLRLIGDQSPASAIVTGASSSYGSGDASYSTWSYALSLSVFPSMIASAILPTISFTARMASSFPGIG